MLEHTFGRQGDLLNLDQVAFALTWVSCYPMTAVLSDSMNDLGTDDLPKQICFLPCKDVRIVHSETIDLDRYNAKIA